MRTLLFVIFLVPLSKLDAQERTYEIRFSNNTPQLLTDAVCAVHSRNAQIFEVGKPATLGLTRLAEDGVSDGFAQELRAVEGVKRVARGDFVSPSARSQLTIRAGRKARVSCVLGMLVVTNDAFPAFQNARLPRKVGQSRRFRALIYDAGTELNTESCQDIPGGPCDAHFIGQSENGTIQPHQGILGIADLSAQQFSWRRRFLRGTIRRVN